MSHSEPRHPGAGGEDSARCRSAGEAPEVRMGVAAACSCLAAGASTNGQFGPYRWDMGPEASGPSTHCHRSISESLFVLPGTVRLFNGDEWLDGRAGDFLFVPGAPRQGCSEGLASGRPFTDQERAAFMVRRDTLWA